MEPGFYFSNFLGQQLIRKDSQGEWKFPIPNDFASARYPVACLNVDEYGLWVRAVLENKEVRDDPRPVLASSEEVSFVEVLEQLSKGWYA